MVLAAAVLGTAAAWAQGAPPLYAPVPTVPAPNAPVPAVPAPNVSAPAVPAPNPAPLSMEELDALVSPVALYPDTLLAQVLIASTYPLEVAMASQWAMQNPSLQGAQLNTALEMQTWDPSVKALVQVPTALNQMSQRLDWTQKLGDAFLAQQKDVMDSVQRLRQRAQGAGKLMTTEQQRVMTEGQTIVIEQADPQMVYVPYYDPYYMYGGWPYAAYPPYYWPTPPGYYLGAGLAFGLGVAIIGGAWDNHFDWNGGDLNVDVNRNNFTNIGRNGNTQRWEHNAEHRRGTNYRDQATRERFGKGNAGQADARRDFRGFDQGQGRGQLADRGGQIGQGQLGQGQLGDRAGGQRSSLERAGQTRGFDGLGNGAATRNYSNRGQASRQAMASGGFSGGARGGGFGGGARGGGGRGGGGGRR
jgi:hypothetical protein